VHLRENQTCLICEKFHNGKYMFKHYKEAHATETVNFPEINICFDSWNPGSRTKLGKSLLAASQISNFAPDIDLKFWYKLEFFLNCIC
jgi:hypothetical protein